MAMGFMILVALEGDILIVYSFGCGGVEFL